MEKVKRVQKGVLKTSQEIDIDILLEHLESLDLSKKDNLNFWLYCRIAMVSGLRSIDILEMKVCDIDFVNNKFTLIEKKTKKRVTAPIKKEITSKIDKSNMYVIWNEKYKTNVSVMTINRRLKNVFNTSKNVSSHSIRKATAKRIYTRTGNDIIKAMIFLNHSSPVMTKNYLGITQDEKEMLYSLLD
jgi:integrase